MGDRQIDQVDDCKHAHKSACKCASTHAERQMRTGRRQRDREIGRERGREGRGDPEGNDWPGVQTSCDVKRSQGPCGFLRSVWHSKAETRGLGLKLRIRV